jgi:LmbE family N-acetylglucosaminyl deacetylase
MFSTHWRSCLGLLGAAGALGFARPAAAAPLPPAAIVQELRSFRTLGTVLHLAAHPDDENTELITWLSLGRGYRTGYLSITRGDGGQNELGKEFDAKLGVLRTQELLAARRLDGGRQFFTRAIDFGFSKNPEETLRIWGHDQVLADVVRVIRQFRPDVIVTRFPVPPGSGGHGHHTASAILAVEAFKLAGDPGAFPDQIAQGLAPWQPKRVLWNSFRFGNAPQPLNGPVFQTDIAGTDPVSGDSFSVIAARSRAMHKTQGLGGFTSRTGNGPNLQYFMLLAGEPARTNTGLAAAGNDAPDLMDGVDTTWARVPGGAGIGPLVDAVIAQFKPDDPSASVPALLAIRAQLATLPTDPLVADKRRQLDHILQDCIGLDVQTTLAHADVVPGEVITLHHTAGIVSAVPVRWLGVRYPGSKPLTPADAVPLAAGQPAARDSTTTIPIDTPLTQPYWLQEDPSPGLFTVNEPELIGRPESPPALTVEQLFEVGGQTLAIADVPVQVITDPARPEVRQPLEVVGPVSLAWGHDLELVAPGATKIVTLELTAARANVSGSLQLEAPAGWTIVPAARPFRLGAVGERTPFNFELTAPKHPGEARIAVRAVVGARRYHRDRTELRYAHLPVQLLQSDAALHAVTFEFGLRAHTVGYLPGAGDSVPDALAQMGCTVRTLTGADLSPEKLAGLDAVVIGVRAFNERTDLKAALPGLFAWVAQGGTVIAQYNRPNGLKAEPLGPYPLSIEGPAPLLRVTDELAPVTFLAPEHRALTTPNKITAADFAGWVQERGTYFPGKWDEAHYTAIFAMSDPGEAPLKGSLLVAPYGKGFYVYSGVAFFRQLPAGVPGAYRLFANLLSLGQ